MKVLIADDDEISLMWLENLLTTWGYEVVTLNNGLKAFAALSQDHEAQLAIIDWMMPGLDGIEICRRIKNDPRLRYHYLIMLTGKSDTKDIVEALQTGADDFIVKPFQPEELQVRLRAGARIIELQKELVMRASHDELTGILNRRLLMDLALREVERARRSNSVMSLLMLDLDEFKNVNDQFGHLAGDAVLKEVAGRIQLGLRAMDIFGRYGGEEFMVLLPSSNTDIARIVADHLRLLVCEQPVMFEDKAISVSISIGLAALSFDHKMSLHELIGNADEALYQAKKMGRNRVEVLVR
jgi:diguanylate cyclase (GGDEF)-like protein